MPRKPRPTSTAHSLGPDQRAQATLNATRHIASARSQRRADEAQRFAQRQGPYRGDELRPFSARAGAMDAFTKPSLIGGRRVAYHWGHVTC